MRELKFRAWDKVAKQMSPEFHLFGEFTLIGGVHAWQYEIRKQEPHNDSLGMLNDLEVMQFIGQKDKNGKEIYEGDLVKSWNLVESPKNAKDKIPSICEVVWDQNFWGIKRANGNGFTGLYISDGEFGVEVIGNKYKNPELLSTGK